MYRSKAHSHIDSTFSFPCVAGHQHTEPRPYLRLVAGSARTSIEHRFVWPESVSRVFQLLTPLYTAVAVKLKAHLNTFRELVSSPPTRLANTIQHVVDLNGFGSCVLF